MSRERALAAINLKKTDRIPNFDGITIHPEFIQKVSGLNLREHWEEAVIRCIKILDVDVIGAGVPSYGRTQEKSDKLVEGKRVIHKKGKAYTKMGAGESEWTVDFASRFPSVKSVLEYDPFSCNEKSVDELALNYRIQHEEDQAFYGRHALASQGIYKSLFMWPVMTFGWEMFLLTAAQEPEEFGKVMERFAKVSMKYFQAWARVDNLHIFSSHDDLAMTRGPVLHPEWYRKYIFPFYPKLWMSLKEKGVKIIFRADGNMDEFIDDIAACGADGFCIRKETNIAKIAKKYGDSKIIIGNIDTRALSFGSKEEIEEEVKRCVAQVGDCPGYFFQASGDIPHNVPLQNVETYFAACKEYGKRN
ncbi:hypothetical protein HQ584_04170 [Patescibacteria group bacterium]|nr:hypothetical protein [Patescibacteria group bacterium]